MKNKMNHILKGGVIAFFALSLSACQMYQSKDNKAGEPMSADKTHSGKMHHSEPSDHYQRTTMFRRDSKMGLIPVGKDGQEFESCGTVNHNDCPLFHNKIKLDSLEPVQIIYIDYQINPHCQVIIIGNRIYFDPNNPHCPNYEP